MESVECVVAGAGVVGLAIARALAEAGREVLLLERGPTFGTGTSSRSSEVIHAGIYYEPGSLMARFCVAGRKALYAYCAARGLPHRACGKLIVATSAEEVPRLSDYAERARGNGVTDLAWLSKAEAMALEPELRCEGALLSPSTGIIDSHSYMLALLGDAEAAGAVFAPNSPLLAARPSGKGLLVRAGLEGESMELECRLLVNAAGLDAPGLARKIEGLDASHVPPVYFSKGNYFTLAGKAPFSRLVYPLPVPGGIGIHLTLDMGGQARFGPDVEPVDGIGYTVDSARAGAFYGAIRRYWPGLADGALQPGYAGIRPKIVPPAQKQDFRIDGPERHGVAGLINLFGIESPGLTSSLAIAEYVRSIAAKF
jgi:L-2-hydroxyglutarate oxidase LhgO